ncbi:hypothetical protein [Mongoliitalea daihaiensis]|uniref:hypothetical protein n=1 Tax=Mongoliitalea daihaiensis TaxID=2782006 RepID=UPI001F1C8BF0|nr:hypothetical protein [Mongoliitalea daihaiensis]UJP63738.1 hypothetical protein IPZ59_12970 [Mongoliitalea daihaiensis]
MKKLMYAMMFSTAFVLASCGNKTTEEVEIEEPAIEETAPVMEEEVEEVELDSAQIEEVQ